MADTNKTVKPPPELSKVDMAFPARAMEWLPAWEDIPKEFKTRDSPWAQQVGLWFFKGADKAWIARITPKEGIDKDKALNVIQATLGSYAPKHEHKIAGAAYLLASWFNDPEVQS